MDLNSISGVLTPATLDELPPWLGGDAWLAGGTWLFSEPQPGISRLIDLATLKWEPLRLDDTSLEIAATCTIAQLAAFAAQESVPVATLIMQCCRSLLGSFKVWNLATVGGNICMALPAGPMTALASALEGVGVVWTGGDPALARPVPIQDLVTGPRTTLLAAGDLLRAVRIPRAVLGRTTAFRRVSLNPVGRTGALVIGTLDTASSAFALTITGSSIRPVRLAFPAIPDADLLQSRIEAEISGPMWFDDVHGDPRWRRHVTMHFAEEIRRELLIGRSP